MTTTVYMDAELSPARSLSPRGFTVFMGILTAFSLILGLHFLSLGLFPVIGFFGLDILLVWLAFRHSFSKQAQRTYVRVTAERIDMRHTGDGKPREASLPTAFAQVSLENSPRGAIRISSSGRTYAIGRFLSPQDRSDFTACLKDALTRARAERHANPEE